jgi:hypothetical protein
LISSGVSNMSPDYRRTRAGNATSPGRRLKLDK